MCSRFVSPAERELATLLRPDVVDPDLPARRVDAFPGRRVPVFLMSVHDGIPVRRLVMAHWGLVPRWAKSVDFGRRTFNARSEEVSAKPAFRGSLGRTAIVPAVDFTEWSGAPGSKRAHRFRLADDGVIGLAGLTAWWADPARPAEDPDRWLLSVAVLTRDAVPPVAAVHDRCPVMVPAAKWDDWLDPHATGSQPRVDAFAALTPLVAANLVVDEQAS